MNVLALPSVIPPRDPATLLMPAEPNKDERHRIGRFAEWLHDTGTAWHNPDLAAYRDSMLEEGYAASTIIVHLSTVRARYRYVVRDNDTRQAIFDAIPEGFSLADRKAFVDEIIQRLHNALDPAAAPVKQVIHQDRADSEHLRLTKTQADALLTAPGLGNLKALRDTALIALLLCTGIREGELVGLEVRDLRQSLGGELALHVREGKGCKERLVPYGDLSWALTIVEKWLQMARIGDKDSAVFCGFWRGGRKTRRGSLSRRAVQLILGEYPIAINGDLVTVKPHDLRRTYARRLYEAGMDLVAIQQNLGHATLETTLSYIGTLDADKRRAPAVYSFDLGVLDDLMI